MKAFYTLLAVLVVSISTSFAQSSKQVNWSFTAKKIADKTYEIHMTATINPEWHMYAQNAGVEGPLPTKFTFTKNPLVNADGEIKEVGNLIKKNEEMFGGMVNYYEKKVEFVKVVKVKANVKTALAGKVLFLVCGERECLVPSEIPFTVQIGG
ncbi:MAG: hypothetical protein K2P88_01260 [Chitinophagaceae bacterium]|uniref:protein-disulfide reductase DsbD domain-containing protein n=1 Tax=unclassified Paraflavitalea TaxID=2798305 RepID=UPI003D32A195|nr:hypothetical protein [Chitinophagaceae bacterium]